MQKIVVSACLAGVPCRYDGANTPCREVIRLVKAGRILPLCPEQLGGLPPRATLCYTDEQIPACFCDSADY